MYEINTHKFSLQKLLLRENYNQTLSRAHKHYFNTVFNYDTMNTFKTGSNTIPSRITQCFTLSWAITFNETKFVKSDRLWVPPLWFSGQSSWLQIQRSRVRFPCFQIFWEVVGLEQGPLSLLSISEELFDWKSNGSGSKKQRLTAVGISCADHATPSIRKSWH
jgi:hypothetical protein